MYTLTCLPDCVDEDTCKEGQRNHAETVEEEQYCVYVGGGRKSGKGGVGEGRGGGRVGGEEWERGGVRGGKRGR